MARDDPTVASAKRGDHDAWRELYEAHAGRLVAWLGVRASGDSALSADDVAAEAWVVAAGRITEFEGDSDAFAGWLFGIARNVSMNVYRRGQRRNTHPDDGSGMPEEHIEFETGLAGQEWVRQQLASLPPRERDVIGCIDGLGMDNAATAAALGISTTAVRVARHRGLRKLRASSDATDGAGVVPEAAPEG